MTTKKETKLKGTDIFNEHKIKLLDGNEYSLKFGMISIALMEEEMGSFEKIFELFTNYSYTNILKATYFAMVTKHKDLRGRKGLAIIDLMDELVDETNIAQVQILTMKEFERFFASIEENQNNLPPEYAKVLEEMSAKNSKKK